MIGFSLKRVRANKAQKRLRAHDLLFFMIGLGWVESVYAASLCSLAYIGSKSIATVSDFRARDGLAVAPFAIGAEVAIG